MKRSTSLSEFQFWAQFSQERDGYWKMMQKYIGSDITSMVTLPVIIFEPMTTLQKMAEVLYMFLDYIYMKRKKKDLHESSS